MGTYSRAIISGLAIIFGAQSAVAAAWEPGREVGEPLASLLKAIQRDSAPIFFSDCYLSDNLKAVMLFRAGSTEADFFLLGIRPPSDNPIVASQGRLSIKSGEFTILHAEGMSEKNLPGVAGSLLAQNFHVVMPEHTDQVFLHVPTSDCVGPRLLGE